MIYSTNRTASIGEIEVDVNESYFGAGSLFFMQENSQEELALFEEAIKSDIDEALIGESATELEALTEGFVQNAANKIKEMMRKFIEWLQGVTRSAIAKMAQLLVRDNGKFCKMARKKITSMKNYSKFKYTGKGLVLSEAEKEMKTDNAPDSKSLYDEASKVTSKEDADRVKSKLATEKEKFENLKLREKFDKECVKEFENEGLDFVEKHIKHLEGLDKKGLSDLRKELKKMEKDANELAKKAQAAANKSSENEDEKVKLSVMAEVAAAYRSMCQAYVQDMLYIIKQNSKIARAVVAKAMGATPKNEGMEYSEELVQAMIEAHEYELDEALEEMSEAKECDNSDDDIEDEE